MKKILLILPLLFFFINVNASILNTNDVYFNTSCSTSNATLISNGNVYTTNTSTFCSVPYFSYNNTSDGGALSLTYNGTKIVTKVCSSDVISTSTPSSPYNSWFSEVFTDNINCSVNDVFGKYYYISGGYLGSVHVNGSINEGYYFNKLTSPVGTKIVYINSLAYDNNEYINFKNGLESNALNSNQCSNIFQTNGTWETNHTSYTTTNNSITITSSGSTSQIAKTINLEKNSTYKVSFNWTNSVDQTAVVSIYGYNSNQNTIFDDFTSGTSGTYTTTINTGNYNTYKFFVHSNLNGNTNTFTINNIMISKVSSTYCEFGSLSNPTNDLKDSITDDSVSDPDSFITQFTNMLSTNGTITQLITLPITMFTSILNNVNGTCSSFNVGNLLGTDLIFPCIDVSTYLGSTLWGVIDVICSGFFVLTIAKKMIKAFNNFSGMKEGDVINND